MGPCVRVESVRAFDVPIRGDMLHVPSGVEIEVTQTRVSVRVPGGPLFAVPRQSVKITFRDDRTAPD